MAVRNLQVQRHYISDYQLLEPVAWQGYHLCYPAWVASWNIWLATIEDDPEADQPCVTIWCGFVMNQTVGLSRLVIICSQANRVLSRDSGYICHITWPPENLWQEMLAYIRDWIGHTVCKAYVSTLPFQSYGQRGSRVVLTLLTGLFQRKGKSLLFLAYFHLDSSKQSMFWFCLPPPNLHIAGLGMKVSLPRWTMLTVRHVSLCGVSKRGLF